MSALTKMFVVLQLVFSLALAVLLVLMVSKQENYREISGNALAGQAALGVQVTSEKAAVASAQGQAQDAQKRLTDAMAKLADSQAQLATLQGKFDAATVQLGTAAHTADVKETNLSTALQAETAANAEKEKELGDLRPQVAKLLTERNDTERALNEALNQNRAAEQAIRKLQEQLASLQSQTPPAGAGGAGGSTVASLSTGSAAAINAKISDVQQFNGRTMVEMPLGSRDGLQNGTRLMIYRGSTYIADAVVNKVLADSAVATVDGAASQSVQKGDMISTVGR